MSGGILGNIFEGNSKERRWRLVAAMSRELVLNTVLEKNYKVKENIRENIKRKELECTSIYNKKNKKIENLQFKFAFAEF